VKKSALLVAITLVIALMFAGCLTSNNYEKVLQKAADDLNAKCPMTIDSQTRLDNVAVLPGKVFQYYYTLTDFSKEELPEETIAQIKQALQSSILNGIKSSTDMKTLRDNDVTFKYVYKSNDSFEVFSLTFLPKDYK
jgi:hypothetical protein